MKPGRLSCPIPFISLLIEMRGRHWVSQSAPNGRFTVRCVSRGHERWLVIAHPDRRGAALRMCRLEIWRRSIAHSLKRISPAATPGTCGSSTVLANCARWTALLTPGRRVQPSAISAKIFRRRHACDPPPQSLRRDEATTRNATPLRPAAARLRRGRARHRGSARF